MRAYKVTVLDTHIAFAGSQSEASSMRRSLADKHNARPLADTNVEEIDVPTDKQGLLKFLNALVP